VKDIDPEEIVKGPDGVMTLRSAVLRVMQQPKAHRQMVLIHRDPGKVPSILDIRHIEELANRPDFKAGGA
jgi:hypothetical protein